MRFYVLGSNPALSIAEFAAVYGSDLDFSACSKDALFTDDRIDANGPVDRLSGIVKAGTLLATQPVPADEQAVVDAVHGLLPEADKLTFGLSVYEGGDPAAASRLSRRHQALGIAIKRRLSERGKVRFLGSKTPALASVAVATNGLLKPGGIEICLFATKAGVLIGRTDAVQDFRSWSARDFGRPGRDPKSGMLPPKLARLMLNLTGLEPAKSSVLDPFCGSGTVLMEAALLGFPRIVGGDNAEKAIADTQRNIEWLEASYRGPHPAWPEIGLHLSTAERIPQEFHEPVDAIVTEPYLGPPLHGRESLERLTENAALLRELYRISFQSLASILRRGGRVVAAIPAFRFRKTLVPVPVIEDFRNMGLKHLASLPPSAPKGFHNALGPQGGLLYEREGQRVAREILVFERL